MNAGERVLAFLAEVLWWVRDTSDRLGEWADDAAHTIRDRATKRVNRVRRKLREEWYANHPMPPAVIHTRPGSLYKRAVVVDDTTGFPS